MVPGTQPTSGLDTVGATGDVDVHQDQIRALRIGETQRLLGRRRRRHHRVAHGFERDGEVECYDAFVLDDQESLALSGHAFGGAILTLGQVVATLSPAGRLRSVLRRRSGGKFSRWQYRVSI